MVFRHYLGLRHRESASGGRGDLVVEANGEIASSSASGGFLAMTNFYSVILRLDRRIQKDKTMDSPIKSGNDGKKSKSESIKGSGLNI